MLHCSGDARDEVPQSMLSVAHAEPAGTVLTSGQSLASAVEALLAAAQPGVAVTRLKGLSRRLRRRRRSGARS